MVLPVVRCVKGVALLEVDGCGCRRGEWLCTCSPVSHEQQPDAADGDTLLVALLQVLLDVLAALIEEAFV